MPLVSVCVPVYNGGELLERSLKSILDQTFSNYELIVVDNGSTDGSYERAQSLVGKDSRARVLRNTHNLGLVGNLNRCVELAQGEFVKFVCHDDWIGPTCLEQLVGAHRPGVGLVVCKRQIEYGPEIDPHARRQFEDYIGWNSFERHFPYLGLVSSEAFSNLVLEHPMDNCIGEPTAVLIDRAVFDHVGLFNPNVIQLCDWEMWMRIGTRFDVAYVPEELALFRVHEGGTSARNLAEQQYQTSTLDPLIILHQMLYAPAHEPLRALAAPLRMVKLKRCFADTAYEAGRMARWGSGASQEKGELGKRRQAWLKTTRDHPEAPHTRTRYFLLRVWCWALNRFFRLRALWTTKNANG